MSRLNKIVFAFLCFGVAAGLVFVALTARPAWQSFWFTVSEWWIVPTWRYWLLAEALFVIAVLGAYFWARSKSWLRPRTTPTFNSWIVVLSASGVAVILLWLYQLPTLTLPTYFLVMPAALVTLLYVFSGRWDWLVAALILLTNVLVTLLASIPDLLLTNSLSLEVFQSLKAILNSGALAGLTGLWLARETTDIVEENHRWKTSR
jgi:hypothetical protein